MWAILTTSEGTAHLASVGRASYSVVCMVNTSAVLRSCVSLSEEGISLLQCTCILVGPTCNCAINDVVYKNTPV